MRRVMHIIALGDSPETDVEPEDGTMVTALCGKTFVWDDARTRYACKQCLLIHLDESEEWRQSHNEVADLRERMQAMSHQIIAEA